MEKGYAKKKLKFCIDELKNEMEEFLYPLSKMELKESEHLCKLCTDGTCIYYNPDLMTKTSVQELKYQIMHIVVHGILGHFEKIAEFTSPKQKQSAWAVMDIQVWWILNMMGMETKDIESAQKVDKLFEGHYDYSHCKMAETDERHAFNLEAARKVLSIDDHNYWTKNPDEGILIFWHDAREGLLQDEKDGVNRDLFSRMIEVTKSVGRGIGNVLSNENGSFRISRSPVRNYEDILRELVNREDTAVEDPYSIDNMIYQYGLDMYGDVALIEPSEESERYTVNTLVIALDVSGSCTTDDIMSLFWGETYGFLSQLKNNISSGEIFLIQCDDEIQKEEHFLVENISEDVPELVKVRGFGGTSFIPVFERIEELRGEGKKINSLIYLTDGMGLYPQKKPDYPVYFVLPDNGFDRQGRLPGWIERVYLRDR